MWGVYRRHVSAVEALPLIRDHLRTLGDHEDDLPRQVAVSHAVGAFLYDDSGDTDGLWQDDPGGEAWTFAYALD